MKNALVNSSPNPATNSAIKTGAVELNENTYIKCFEAVTILFLSYSKNPLKPVSLL